LRRTLHESRARPHGRLRQSMVAWAFNAAPSCVIRWQSVGVGTHIFAFHAQTISALAGRVSPVPRPGIPHVADRAARWLGLDHPDRTVPFYRRQVATGTNLVSILSIWSRNHWGASLLSRARMREKRVGGRIERW